MHRSGRRYRVPILAGVMLIAGVALIWGWRITGVEVTGATIVPNAVIRDAVLATLQESRWGIFPRSSMILVGPHALGAELQEQFALASAVVHRGWNRTLTVTVAEQRIAGIVEVVGRTPMLMAVTGRAVSTASDRVLSAFGAPPTGGASSALPIIHPTDPPAIGAAVVPETSVELIRSIWSELGGLGSPALAPKFVTPRAGTTSFEFSTSSGALIVATADEDAGAQLVKLRTLLSGMPEDRRAAVHSIDIRYGDRVYVQ